jgi:hypothetical protein
LFIATWFYGAAGYKTRWGIYSPAERLLASKVSDPLSSSYDGSRRRWEDNIKMGFREMGYEVNSNELARKRVFSGELL